MLDLFLKKTNQGKVIGSRFAMRLGAKLIFEPDLMVILTQSLSKLKPTYLDGSSEFVIEILSAATKETDLTKKISHYLEKGVREIWAIDPSKRELTVFSPKNVPKIYSREETVKSTIITNFWIKLNWLWNSEKQDPLSCLHEIVK